MTTQTPHGLQTIMTKFMSEAKSMHVICQQFVISSERGQLHKLLHKLNYGMNKQRKGKVFSP